MLRESREQEESWIGGFNAGFVKIRVVALSFPSVDILYQKNCIENKIIDLF